MLCKHLWTFILWFTLNCAVGQYVAQAQTPLPQSVPRQPASPFEVKPKLPQPSQRPHTFAVVGFKTYCDQKYLPDNEWVGISFGDTLATKLANLEVLRAVERINLHELLHAHQLRHAQIDGNDEKDVRQVTQTIRGSLISAEYLMVGSVNLRGSSNDDATELTVSARIVDVETGVMGVKDVNGNVSPVPGITLHGTMREFYKLQEDLALQYCRLLQITLTSAEESSLKRHETESLEIHRTFQEGNLFFDAGDYAKARDKYDLAYEKSGRTYSEARVRSQQAQEKYLEWLKALGKNIREEREKTLDEYRRRRQEAKEGYALESYVLAEQLVWDAHQDELDGASEQARKKYEEAIQYYQDFLNNTSRQVVKWKFKADHWMVGSPCVASNTVYIGAADGHFYALDAHEGPKKEVKKFWLERQLAVWDTIPAPYVADDTIYVSTDSYLWALDIKTGKEKWPKFTTLPARYRNSSLSEYFSSPYVVDGTVYILGGQYFYAVDAQTGRERWRFETGGMVASMAVTDGIIYVGSLDGHIYALDSKKKEIWSAETGGWVTAIAVASGIVYAGGDNYLYAFDAKNGGKILSFEMKGRVTALVIVDGIVYAGAGDFLYAFKAKDGARKWTFKMDGRVSPSPVIIDGIVYAGSWDGYLYALDAEKGTLIWSYETKGRVTSPVVADGIVYVGAWDGHLYALGAIQAFGGVQDVDVLFAIGNAYLKLEQYGDAKESYEKVIKSKPNYSAEIYQQFALTCEKLQDYSSAVSAWLQYLSRNPQGRKDEISMKHLYQIAGVKWRFKPDDSSVTSFTLANDIVYVGTENDQLYALSGQKGEQLWNYHIEGLYAYSLVVYSGIVYVNGENKLYALDAGSGSPLWNFQPCGLRVVFSGQIVYIGADNHIYTLNAKTGALIWEVKTPNSVYSLDVAEEIVYAGGDNFLYALDAQGTLKRKFDTQGWVTSLEVTGGIVYAEVDNYLYAFDTQKGALIWKIKKGRKLPLPVISEDTVYVVVGEEKQRAEPTQRILKTPIKEDEILLLGMPKDYYLVALDVQKWREKWKFNLGTGADWRAALALSKNIICVNVGEGFSYEHTLYAIDAQKGTLKWKRRMHRGVPAVSSGIVYRGEYALDAQTGWVRWKFKTALNGVSESSVYAISEEDGSIYALDLQQIETLLKQGRRWWDEEWQDVLSEFAVAPNMEEKYRLLQKASELAGEDYNAHQTIARMFFELGKYPEASQEAKLLIRLQPSEGYGYFLLARIAEAENNLEAVAQNLKQITQLYPQFTEVYVKLADVLSRLNKKEEAIETYRQALRLNPQDDNVRAKLAWELLNVQRYDEARHEVEKIFERQPDNAGGYWLLAQIDIGENNLEAAEQNLRRMIQLATEVAQVAAGYAGLGKVLVGLNRTEEAIEAYRQALRLNPQDDYARLDLSWELLKLRKSDEARQEAEKVIQNQPEGPDGYWVLAHIAIEENNLEVAELHLKRVTQLAPEFVEGYAKLGNVLSQLNRVDEAIAACEKAIELGEQDASVFGNLGWCYYLQGKYESALEVSQKALELNPNFAPVQFNVGLIFIRLHQLEAAIAAYEKALKIDAEVHDGGITDLLDALKQEPSLPEAHFALGLLYEAKQDWVKAKEQWQLYLQADTESQWAELAREHLKKLEK